MIRFGSNGVYLSGDNELYRYINGNLQPLNMVGFKYNVDANPFTPEFFGLPVHIYQEAIGDLSAVYLDVKLAPQAEINGIPKIELSVPAGDAYFVFANKVAVSAPGHCLKLALFGPTQAMRMLSEGIQGSGNPGLLAEVMK